MELLPVLPTLTGQTDNLDLHALARAAGWKSDNLYDPQKGGFPRASWIGATQIPHNVPRRQVTRKRCIHTYMLDTSRREGTKA